MLASGRKSDATTAVVSRVDGRVAETDVQLGDAAR
jgi:hypothetical protein